MDFVDSTLIRIADSSTRAAVFDEECLGQMAAAAYDASALSLDGPYAAVFDKLTLGLSVTPVGAVEGTVRDERGAPMADLHIQVSGLGPLLPARVDAVWFGSIVAQSQPADSRIAGVKVQFQVADIDAGIIQSKGSLPTDPTALEAARRSALIAEMQASMADPTGLTDDAFNSWLTEIGASSVSDLVANRRGTTMPSVVQVQMSDPTAKQQASPRALPIIAALLVRDTGFSIAELLMESKMLREQLSERGVGVPTNSSLPALNPLLVVWVVPITVFDDAGWPGTGGTQADLRTSRRQNASVWLGPEGVAVAGVA